MSRLVFVPCSREIAGALRDGRSEGPWHVYTPSSGLGAESGEPSGDELEYVALNHAGVARLVDPSATDELRLVLAAEVPAEEVLDVDAAEPGTATVAQLTWSRVIALFADAPEAAESVHAARRAVRGQTVPEALTAAGVATLLDRHDLLWFAPEELAGLP